MGNAIAEKKITSIHWIKARTVTEALSMVAAGKADAMGVWDYYYADRYINKNDFKIFYKINGLETPVLYVNTSNVDEANIEKIKTALEHGDDQPLAPFTYHLE